MYQMQWKEKYSGRVWASFGEQYKTAKECADALCEWIWGPDFEAKETYSRFFTYGVSVNKPGEGFFSIAKI